MNDDSKSTVVNIATTITIAFILIVLAAIACAVVALILRAAGLL